MPGRSTRARPFGRAAEDLEIDFTTDDRPALVTALLAAGAAPGDGEHWWQSPVGERTAALLALLRETEGAEVMAIGVQCAAAGCGARMEIELPHEVFAAPAGTRAILRIERDNGDTLSLRRPTGADLRAWRALRRASREQAVMGILASLTVTGDPRLDDAERVATALAEADPLVGFSLFCACPTCGDEAEHDIDLEGVALQRLAARQRALLYDVHTLAMRYGWTEADIFAVAPARRARYLQLIEGLV